MQPLLIKQQKKSASFWETLVHFSPLPVSPLHVISRFLCIQSKKKKMLLILVVLLILQSLSHERRGCNSRMLGLLGGQHRVPVSVQNHFISSIAEALSTGMKLWYCAEKVSVLL